jgi:hypothetical protein
MKNIHKAVVAILIAAAITGAFVKPAQADTNQNATINCSTSGSYGQTTCTVNQNNVENNVLGVTKVHKTVDAGMDTPTAAAAVAGLITSTGGAIITLKKKIA